MKKAILFIFLLLSHAVCAKIQPIEKSPNSISNIFNEKTNFGIKENRKNLAINLIANLQKFDKIIPKNTPEDESWLKTEMRESNTGSSRKINYLKTPIFSKYRLKNHIKNIIEKLNAIAEDSVTLKVEAI